MLGVWQLVLDVVAGEEVERLVDREVEGLVGSGARSRCGEGEALIERQTGRADAERFVEHDRQRRSPVETERRVGYFVEEVQVFDRGVVEAVRCADAALTWSAEDLAQNSFGEVRRVSKSKPRSKVVVSRRGQRFGNAFVTGIYEAFRRTWEDCRLLSLDPGLDFSLRVLPGHARFPSKTQIQRQVGSRFP